MENENNSTKGLSKNFWIIIGALLLIIIVVVAVIMTSDTYKIDPTVRPPAETVTDSDEDLDTGFDLGDLDAEEAPFQDPGTSVVAGTSAIVDDQVVDREGQPVRTDVAPMTPSAPQQSNPLDPDELPDEVIKLEVSAAGWNPSEFTVGAGEIITFSVTSVDDFTHIFRFDDESLNAVALGVSSNQTRALTFKAPLEPGEYTFRCGVPGHARRGEVGVMIVE